MRRKGLVEHQPDVQRSAGGRVELVGGQDFEIALADLAGFTRIWLIFWFHHNSTWRLKVLPPRGRTGRRSLFATRAPYRPNPIGMTSVPLREVRGRVLEIGPHDLLDGTPILDIKPYIPEFDAHPHERVGWLEDLTEPAGRFLLSWSPRARAQIDWLNAHYHPELGERITRILSSDPFPHKTRRITRTPRGLRLGCGAWRVYYEVVEQTVEIAEVESALYEPSEHAEAPLHRAFRARCWES